MKNFEASKLISVDGKTRNEIIRRIWARGRKCESKIDPESKKKKESNKILEREKRQTEEKKRERTIPMESKIRSNATVDNGSLTTAESKFLRGKRRWRVLIRERGKSTTRADHVGVIRGKRKH